MQHWVLCELFDQLSHENNPHLLFVCTHSMAPWSVPEEVDYGSVHSPRLHRRRPYDEVRQRLYQRPTSSYERYWQSLSSHAGTPYPSSAVFASTAWSRKLSLLLCEQVPNTADEIHAWMSLPEVKTRLTHASLYRGDWRKGLDSSFITTAQPDVILIELDPMQFEHRNPVPGRDKNAVLLYPEDMDILLRFIAATTVPVVVQVSSYDTNNGNSQTDTIPAISTPLLMNGFTEAARVKSNDLMVSLVFSRGLVLCPSPASLNQRFNDWLSA